MTDKWDYKVSNYAGLNYHSEKAPLGSLVLETVHTHLSSVQAEIHASLDRLERGELIRFEVIDLRKKP